MKKLLLLIMCGWWSAQAAVTRAPLERLQTALTHSEFTDLYRRYEQICLLIQTASQEKQEALYRKLESAALGSRSPENMRTTLDTFLEDTITPHAFSQPRARYWHPQFLTPQDDENEHLKGVWKVLTFVACCSAGYLIMTYIRNSSAQSQMRSFNLQRFTRNEAFTYGAEAADRVH